VQQRQSLLNRIFNPGINQVPETRQAMVPVNGHNEYRLPADDSISDNELAGHLGNAPEIDLNTQRSVKPHILWRY